METIPQFQDVRALASKLRRPCLIPLALRSSVLENPAEVYLNLRKRCESSYLLESMDGAGGGSRFSVIGSHPLLHLRVQNGECEIDGPPQIAEASEGRTRNLKGGDALEVLKRAMFTEEMNPPTINLPRYILGFTGYLSYDFVRSHVDLQSNTTNDLHHPTLEFMLPGSVIVFDHLKGLTYYASLLLLVEGMDLREAYSDTIERLEEVISIEPSEGEEGKDRITTHSNFGKEDFEKSVRKIKEYIRARDTIQTVISRRIDLDPAPNLGSFYQELRRINPSPYMFLLDFPDLSVVGSSPEALLRVQGDKVLTRPIAGTRRRGKDEAEDLEMERDLMGDEKERAEHVMLVDLGRNDIGKVSEFGTVETPEFMEVEKYGDVQHIVSTVTGRLRGDLDAFETLRAVFPAGTVTGAPKVRAMEIIDELEPVRRGIYSGAIGSFSYTGDADFAIAIRSLTKEDQEAHIQVGAGIVADSIPEKEYYETEDKARSLLRAAGAEDESGRDR